MKDTQNADRATLSQQVAEIEVEIMQHRREIRALARKQLELFKQVQHTCLNCLKGSPLKEWAFVLTERLRGLDGNEAVHWETLPPNEGEIVCPGCGASSDPSMRILGYIFHCKERDIGWGDLFASAQKKRR